MITPIQTFKAVCDKCGVIKIFTNEGSNYFGYPLPEGWGRIEDRPPQPNNGFTTLRFSYPTYSTHKEYCPTCYEGVVKYEQEREQREKHAEKYL